jgi:hydrogenase-1 operon protein HyaE
MTSRNPSIRPRHALPTLDVAEVDAFLTSAEAVGAVPVLLFAGDAVRWPESTDVAVVLPELIEAFQGRLRGAVIAPQAETALATRFGVQVYPSLVLWSGGEVLEIIPKIKDWSVYVARISAVLNGGGGKPPRSTAKVVKSMSFLNRGAS